MGTEISMNKNLTTHMELAAIESISKSILHDLATSISVIDGSTILMKNGDSKSMQNEYLDRISDSVEQMQLIISNCNEIFTNQKEKDMFYPYECVDLVRNILISELLMKSISLNNHVLKSDELFGNSGKCSRIIFDAVLKAISKISSKKSSKSEINIYGEKKGDHFYFELFIDDESSFYIQLL